MVTINQLKRDWRELTFWWSCLTGKHKTKKAYSLGYIVEDDCLCGKRVGQIRTFSGKAMDEYKLTSKDSTDIIPVAQPEGSAITYNRGNGGLSENERTARVV